MASHSYPQIRNTRSSRSLALAAAVTLLSGTALAAPAVGAAPHIAAALVGASDPARSLTLSLYLPSRDPAGLATFLQHVTKHGDPLYRAYLTPEQYEARFGASNEDYLAVLAWARSQGLVPGEYLTGRHVIPVTGTVQAMEAAFGTHFNDYRDSTGAVFYAAATDAKLPASIAARVTAIVGLNGQARFAPMARLLPTGAKPLGLGTGPKGAFSAADLVSIYSAPVQTFGPAQTVAVFEQGGFEASDVTAYVTANKLRPASVHVRNVDGWNGSISSQDVAVEAVLDIDMENALNPQAGRILVYEQGKSAFPVALLDSLAAMAKDNTAKSIGISYGTDEAIQGSDAIMAENGEFQQLTAQGQAVFVSSGDQGAFGRSGGGLNVSDPCTQPFATCVGGTTVFPGPKETYGVEEVWNNLDAGYGATGGGISTVWSLPAYQKPGGYSVTVGNGGSSTMRNVPDVATVANPLTGVAIYSAANGGWIVIGGTSVSAPIWAGYYSVVTAAAEGLGFGAPGFANPGIYNIAAFGGLVQTAFNDVQDGYNGSYYQGQSYGFFAGSEYDNTTGWGSMIGSAFMVNFLTPGTGTGTPPAAPKGFKGVPASTSVALSWNPAKGASGYAVLVTNEDTGTAQTQSLTKLPKVDITGLAPSTSYYFQLYSLAAAGPTMGNAITVNTTAK